MAFFVSNLLFVSVSEVPDLYSNPDLKSGSGLFSVIGTVCYGKDTMASSHRFSSAPMADTKGKGILYEEEDEPIQLVEVMIHTPFVSLACL